MNQKMKDAIMDAVYTPLERDDMQTPCTLPFMTSSEHGVCDGDGCPVSDETIASALNAVAKIQTEYNKLKKGNQKETQKGTQKEMTDESSPRPWHVMRFSEEDEPDRIVDANGDEVAIELLEADAALIVDAVNNADSWRGAYIKARTERNAFLLERDRLRDLVKRMIPFVEKCHSDALDVSKTIKGICALKGVDTSEIDRINSEHDALIAEARSAIGEDKQ